MSCLLILFYTSMILAHILSEQMKYIESYEDLANAEVMTTTLMNSTYEIMISVIIIHNILFDYFKMTSIL